MMGRGKYRGRPGIVLYIMCTCGQAIFKYRPARATPEELNAAFELLTNPRYETRPVSYSEYRMKGPPGEGCICWAHAHIEQQERNTRAPKTLRRASVNRHAD